eukprot:GFYU01038526.1.p1 GENE.GFYU01038526.1~~GFYU01038526.1.p1  ORF type:complete len:109 (+),score=3.43 GFYU01038526.1:3-329(+)
MPSVEAVKSYAVSEEQCNQLTITDLTDELMRTHYKTLQSMCLHGGSTLNNRFVGFKVNETDWRKCHATGVGCRATMVRNIVNMLTRSQAASEEQAEVPTQPTQLLPDN